MKRPRIILADDHALLLDALKGLLERNFEVVGTFQDGQTLLDEGPALNPDVVVLDIGMPQMNGLEAGERLKNLLPKVKIIYLTMNLDPALAEESFRLGASGFLIKTSAGSELNRAIEDVMLGRRYVAPVIRKAIDERPLHNLRRRKSTQKLTSRQKEVLQLLTEGRSMKEVGHLLNISPRTIAFHKYSIMDQHQLKTSAELIQFAVKHSLVSTS